MVVDSAGFMLFLAGLVAGAGVVAWALRRGQVELARKNTELEEKNAGLAELVTTLRVEKAELEQAQKWLENVREEMTTLFKASAADALAQNRDQFKEKLDGLIKEFEGSLRTHKAKVDNVVSPLGDLLKQLDKHVSDFKTEWTGGYKVIKDNFDTIKVLQTELRDTTSGLKNALKSSTVRGRWGEIELRRIVEMAGLSEHVSFSEQTGSGEGRPDMTVRLPENVIIPVDAKTPLNSYLDAVEAGDEVLYKQHMQKHSDAVKVTIDRLSRKKYWEDLQKQHGSRIDFVVMFIPLESALGGAFALNPSLLEDAIAKGVFPTTPVTLLALLRTVSYGWQQVQLAENAKKIADAGRELYDRFRIFFEHFQKVGADLASAGESYSSAVGSYERRLYPSLEDFLKLGVQTSKALPDSMPVTPEPRFAGKVLPESEN